MKKIGTGFIIAVIFLSLFPLAGLAGQPENYGTVQAKYVKNYDGDTITVNIKGYPAIIGKEITVRVNGIDTPEIKGTSGTVKDMARAAKRLTENLCKRAKNLELRNMQRGKYFRIVADVYVDGKNLAEILIKNGLAKPYDGGKKPEWK